MKKLLAPSLLAAATLGASAGIAAECGEVTIASMNWQSAEVLSNIDKMILGEGYGCDAEIIIGDTVPIITSMVEKGQPDIAPEGWVDLLPEVVENGLKEGKLVQAASALTDGGVQGWWIPKYLADAHPDIKSIPDALEHPELFPDPENPGKGAIFNGPQGWGGTVVTTQFFKAYGAEAAGFTLVDPGSAAGLDGSIARAYEQKQGWIGYYWEPTALMGKYDMVRLDFAAEADPEAWQACNTNPDCADPKPNVWPTDRVVTLVAASFAERAGGEVMAYLNARSWDNATVNQLMAWMTDNQATGEEGARHFLEENEELWTSWVPADVAEKVKSAL